MTYVVVDQFFSWDDIIQDIMKRPYITVGFTGFVLLVPLTVTSTAKMIKRLGKRWLQLHRLVYAIGILGVIHYLWQVKADISSPAKYGAILAVLLGYRAWAMLDKRRRLGLRGIWPQTKQPLQASRKST